MGQDVTAGALRALTRFWRDERGATAIEYAMIAVGVGAAIAATVYTLGDVVFSKYFERIANETNR
ncbi:Flp family type IVb pilin [Methylopila henanensis]|uniref:Flp family type IVb pilin n=1 Tax=Methylopila henanensis TaxID=873516 RepID=A0ABW4K6S9_9HYPH